MAEDLLQSDARTARHVASDAIRELTRDAVQHRIRKPDPSLQRRMH